MKSIRNNSDIFRLFLRFLFFLVIIEIIIFLGVVQFYESHKKDLIMTHEEELLKTLKNQIVYSLDRVESDLRFLSNYIEDEYSDNTDFKQNVGMKLSMFSSAKLIYDQIRLLDTTGKEWIRVNISENQGIVVADNLLQDKSNRYYFRNSINLSPNSIFVSPLDLNIENGKVELPYKPMIRFAKPLFKENGEKFGVLILNYLADTLLKEFRRESEHSDGKIFLTNSAGFYFVGPDSESEWGFMFPEKTESNIKEMFPSVWQIATFSNSNQAEIGDGIITHNNIKYIAENQSNSNLLISDSEIEDYASTVNYWHIISYVDDDAISSILYPIKRNNFIILSILFIGMAPLLYFLARNISIRKAAIQKIIDNKAELAELNAMKDKLFSIIAHDLRNPLQVLILSSELLKVHFEKKYYEKMEKDIYKLINTTNSFKELLESLLTWSISQAGKIPFERQPFNLAEICQKSINICKGNAELKDITIETINCKHTEVMADPNMISTVFQNLIFNAIKFTPIKGKISISFKEDKKYIEIAVMDTGIGMTEEEIENILKIDVHFTKRGTEGEAGSGIGILLCKEFVEKHGGNFNIESQVGVGSTFTFTIPKVKMQNIESSDIEDEVAIRNN